MPFMYIQGRAGVAQYEAICRHHGLDPSQRKVVFLFPGNASHHGPATTLFSIKTGAGLAQAAANIGRAGYPCLSLPTTSMEQWSQDNNQQAIVQSAIKDLYRAVGAGFSLMLPVRNHPGNSAYFDHGLDESEIYEPSFWGGVQAASNKALANHYILQLNSLSQFMKLDQAMRLACCQNDASNPFYQAYMQGLNMEENDAWLVNPHAIKVTEKSNLSEGELNHLKDTVVNQRDLNVSGAFDNCFFHSYVLHLLTNKLPLPEDLFSFESILGPDSPASKLQAQFPNMASLSVFEEYVQKYQPSTAAISPHCLFEKTLVLGILMREYFATTMFKHPHICDDEPNIITSFKSYKDYRPFAQIAMLTSGPEGVLYIANEPFLEYFYQRPKNENLSEDEKRFEAYFVEAEQDVDEALKLFWRREGYKNYCVHTAYASTKLSYNNFMPVIKMIGQAITISNATDNSIIISAHGHHNHLPPLNLKLNAELGHYYLIKTAETESLLNEYALSNLIYNNERAKVLEISILRERREIAHQKSSLLLAAICPAREVTGSPFGLLLEKIARIKNRLSLEEEQKQAEANSGHELEPVAAQEPEVLEDHQAEVIAAQEPRVLVRRESHLRFNLALQTLLDKRAEFENKDAAKYRRAYDAVTRLHDSLEAEGELYFNHPASKESYETFRGNCKNHLDTARVELKKHRAWGKILVNIFAMILTLGIGYAIAVGVNMAQNKGKFTFFATDSALKLDEMETYINKAAPGA